MKLRCTNTDERVVVLSFVGDDDTNLVAVSLPSEVIEAEIGDEFRIVKSKPRANKAASSMKPRKKKK